MELIYKSKLIPIPSKVDAWYKFYNKTPEMVYGADASIHTFLNLDYAQFIAAIEFLYPDSIPNRKSPRLKEIETYFMCVVPDRKRLFFFVSIPVDTKFRAFLNQLVGKDNIYTYSQYLSLKNANLYVKPK